MSLQENHGKNDIETYLKMGNSYYYGQNVPADMSTAVTYYKMASDLGSAMGKAMLGEMYYRGRGVGQDIRTAKKYLKEAADMKCTYALYVLGLMCYKGDYGFWASKGKAFTYWERASKLGHPASQYMIASSYLGDEWGAEMSLRKAAYWFMCAYQNRNASKEIIEKAKQWLDRLDDEINLVDIKAEIIRKHPEYLNL